MAPPLKGVEGWLFGNEEESVFAGECDMGLPGESSESTDSFVLYRKKISVGGEFW